MEYKQTFLHKFTVGQQYSSNHPLILRYGHLTSHKPALNSPLAQTADFP